MIMTTGSGKFRRASELVRPTVDPAQVTMVVGAGLEYTTLAAALTSATSGDVILIAPGTTLYEDDEGPWTVPDGVSVIGYDPVRTVLSRKSLTFTNATWDNTAKTLTLAGAFATFTPAGANYIGYATLNCVRFTGGTGVATNIYASAVKTSDNVLTIAGLNTANAADVSGVVVRGGPMLILLGNNYVSGIDIVGSDNDSPGIVYDGPNITVEHCRVGGHTFTAIFGPLCEGSTELFQNNYIYAVHDDIFSVAEKGTLKPNLTPATTIRVEHNTVYSNTNGYRGTNMFSLNGASDHQCTPTIESHYNTVFWTMTGTVNCFSYYKDFGYCKLNAPVFRSSHNRIRVVNTTVGATDWQIFHLNKGSPSSIGFYALPIFFDQVTSDDDLFDYWIDSGSSVYLTKGFAERTNGHTKGDVPPTVTTTGGNANRYAATGCNVQYQTTLTVRSGIEDSSAPTAGETVSVNLNAANPACWKAGENETVNLSGSQYSGQRITLIVSSDGTARTLTLGNGFAAGQSDITAPATGIQIAQFLSDGTSMTLVA